MENKAVPKAYMGDEPYIFVSYAHKDSDRVFPLIFELQKRFRVWFDDGIHYGVEWEEEISTRLNGCTGFIFVVTETSLESENCKDELYLARKRKKNFINLLFESGLEEPEWFELRYSRYQMCFLDRFASFGEAADDLLRKCDWLKDLLIEAPGNPAEDAPTEELSAEEYYIKIESKLSDLSPNEDLSAEESYKKGKDFDKKGDYENAVKYYRIAADQGHMRAQFNLALCYEKGEGVAKDYKEAVKYYKLAADQGYAKAQNNLALCYDNGYGVAQDYKKAAIYYKLAADQGDVEAQYNLALCYDNGQGVAQNDKEAARYYKLATDQGDMDAQYNVALCYHIGRGVAKDCKEAARYYKLAADQGHTAAKRFLKQLEATPAGELLSVEENFSKGKEFYFRLDYIKAVKYYKLAADQGHAEAQYNLGRCYEKGEGVSKDYKEAEKYYKLAADQGDVTAQFNLARCYTRLCFQGTYKDAAKYYKLAADQGNAAAQYKLAFWYESGIGVDKDYKEAEKYYKLAADQGHAEAQFDLAYRYEHGKGVDQDCKEAAGYYKLAADQGRIGAKKALKRLERRGY